MMIQSVDIITQILYRLPSKSVGQFRCVSKGWLSLLTDPNFIKTHQKTLKCNPLIFADRDNRLFYSHPFDHHDPFILKPTKLPIELGDHITFHGSCDGLVLVSYHTRNMSPLDTLVLLNPTTRESVQLPQSAGCHYHHDYSTHGVGYDSVTDDYKVITLTYYRPDRIDRVSLYSLRSNTWRQLIIDSPYDCYFSRSTVYVNGFLHWFGKKKDSGDCSPVIVAFSLADECFSEVPSPNDTEIMYNHNCKLVVLGGKLAIYVNSDSKWSDVKFEVWLMNEYGVKESWTKIPFDIFDDEFPMVSSTIFDDDNGKIWVAGNRQMLIYDFEKRTLSKTVYVLSRRFWLLGSYVESLVSPKTKDTADHSEAAKILNHKKASLRKKEREEDQEAKPKNKRKKRQRI